MWRQQQHVFIKFQYEPSSDPDIYIQDCPLIKITRSGLWSGEFIKKVILSHFSSVTLLKSIFETSMAKSSILFSSVPSLIGFLFSLGIFWIDALCLPATTFLWYYQFDAFKHWGLLFSWIQNFYENDKDYFVIISGSFSCLFFARKYLYTKWYLQIFTSSVPLW